MDRQIEEIIALFHPEQPLCWTVNEICRKDNDSRWTVVVEFPTERFVIKIAANGFTSVARVNGWPDIIAAYRELGYYSPPLRKSRQGRYAETVSFQDKLCVVWEEEYAAYHLRETLEKAVYTAPNNRYVYTDEVLEFVGKVAQQHYDMFPYKSGWVRLEPFGVQEETDEITDCVQTFDSLVREKAPRHLRRWEEVRTLFEENKRRLAAIYPKLPTSVFQSDHFGDNLLLDREGHFKGVIDYNLAGTDTAINVFLYTTLYGTPQEAPQAAEGLLPEYNVISQDRVVQRLLDTLRYLRKFYTFNELEAQAILPLFKYVTCVEYRQIGLLKKYQSDDEKLGLLFDTMKAELLRREDRFYAAMLSE